MILAVVARISSLIREQSDAEFKMAGIMSKIRKLNTYASNMSDGKISMADMMSAPASIFGRQLMFMQYAHNTAVAGAQQQMTMMGPMLSQQMAQMQDPQQRAMYQNWIMQNLYEQQKKQVCEQETKFLKEQEDELQEEKTKLEAELKMINLQLEAAKQLRDKSIDGMKPNFG